MKARWLTVLALVACGRPVTEQPSPPSAPVLDSAAPLQHRRHFMLSGVAADDAAVRVFADTACSGPVYLQTTGAELREGVKVELVAGVDNAFSANAVSSLGVTSGCSAPLHLRYEVAQRPGLPAVVSRPSSPSISTHFVLAGAVENFARVRFYESRCNTPALAELSVAEFFEPGFPVDVPANGSRTLAIEAVNEDQNSGCVLMVLTNDSIAPQFGVRLASPTPSPQLVGYVHVTGDLDGQLRVYEEPGCRGRQLAACTSCSVPQPAFSPFVTPFSVQITDRAGNSACVEGDRPWVYDPLLPEEEATVLVEGRPLLGQVPAGRIFVDLFPSADCSGQALQVYSYNLLSGLQLTLPPGFITARGVRVDGGLDPCSNAVYWQP